MWDVIIYAGFGVVGVLSIRRLMRIRRQAERDHAAIERVRNLKLPPPSRPGHRIILPGTPIPADLTNGDILITGAQTMGYVPPAPDAGSVAEPWTPSAIDLFQASQPYSDPSPSSSDSFTGGGGDFGGGGAGGSWDSGSSSSSFD